MSKEKDKGSGFIEFDDEEPVDRATLGGSHHLETVKIKVIGVPQEDIKQKYEQQKPREDARQGTREGRLVGIPGTSLEEKRGQPGKGSFRGPREREITDSGESRINTKRNSSSNNRETQGATKQPQSDTPEGQGQGPLKKGKRQWETGPRR